MYCIQDNCGKAFTARSFSFVFYHNCWVSIRACSRNCVYIVNNRQCILLYNVNVIYSCLFLMPCLVCLFWCFPRGREIIWELFIEHFTYPLGVCSQWALFINNGPILYRSPILYGSALALLFILFTALASLFTLSFSWEALMLFSVSKNATFLKYFLPSFGSPHKKFEIFILRHIRTLQSRDIIHTCFIL